MERVYVELGDRGVKQHDAALLAPIDVSRELRVAVKTLEKWRSEGRGPAWVRLGRRVAYQREAVLDFVRSQETRGQREKAPMEEGLEVTSRPYWKDRSRQHVDIMFAHPHTQQPFRKRIVAPAGLDADKATEWGRKQALRLYMEQCKAPKGSDATEESEDETATTKQKTTSTPVLTLSELWDVYALRHVSALKNSTRVDIDGCWRNHIRAVLGPCRLNEIDQAALERLRSALETRRLNVGSQKNVMAKLDRCLKWAVEHQYVKMDIPRVRFGKQRKIRKPVYSKEQWEALTEVASTPRDRLLAVLLTDGVLRIGETAGLQWSDIDFEHGVMTIARNVCRGVLQESPKGEIGDVPLTPRLAAMLLKYKGEKNASPWVLGRTVKGEPTFCTDSLLKKRVYLLQREANIPVWGGHRVRHSILTFLAESGVTPYALQAFARHADMATTMRYYIHLDRLKLAREAVSILAGLTAPRSSAPRSRSAGAGNAAATSGNRRRSGVVA